MIAGLTKAEKTVSSKMSNNELSCAISVTVQVTSTMQLRVLGVLLEDTSTRTKPRRR